ncbi:MAG: choice-of-anchor L domain-containing protein [Flavobacteriales bacterium]|nr:choice-of-anchor L domain-containing protein [Flavobacteriales bacterium]
MRGLIPYIFGLLLFAGAANAQLVIDQSYTPQQLVQDVLVGQGVEVSNIQFTGNAAAKGYFNGSNSNLGLSEGVIISTGKVTDAPGPNGTPLSDDGTDFSGPGNAALSAIAGGLTNDAAVLEFDFIPISDTVQFKYVFASNEYMFYVGADFNDVFAFLITGPGIVGQDNVALIPGTATPVTIDNVNANVNSQYYVDNENPPGSTVEYNGFTSVLTSLAVLQPCETYHIRLAIADAGDGLFDSAVFLEARSFTSPSISINAETSYSASTSGNLELVEGCSQTTLTFERSEPYDNPLSVGLNISGTATNGDDITNIPPFITFNAGQSVTTISFSVIEDGLIEGVEEMTITLDQLNPCATGPATSVTFSIEDVVPMAIQITPDVNLTCPEERTIDVAATGGYPPYTYSWTGSSDTDESITVFPFSTATYTAAVTDACGFTQTASSTVEVLTYQVMQVSITDATVCLGDAATLEATVVGGRVPLIYQWPDGSTGTTYTLTPSQNAEIEVQVTDDCNITETGVGDITVDQVEASFVHQLIGHATVQFTSNTVDVHNFTWEFGDDSISTAENPIHEYAEAGDYQVTLTVVNQSGCDTTLIDSVTVYDPLHVYIPNAFTPNGDSLNDWWGVVGEGYLYYDLEIYDRWGQLILEGRFDDPNAWDGTFKGKKLPAGQYIYKVWVEPPIGIEVKETDVVRVLSGE